MKKIIVFDKEAREKLKRGIDTASSLIALTIGPAGRNVLIGRPYQTPLISNDGYTVGLNTVLEDEVEELGAQMVKQVSKLANDKAGDGTTTTTVLLKSIVDVVYNKTSSKTLLDTQSNVMDIKREIEVACEKVIKSIESKKTIIKTKEDLVKIAIVSVESEEIGKNIAEMIWNLGEDALVTVETSLGRDIDYSIIDGAEIKSGWVSEYLCNNGREAVYEKPTILLTNHKIESPIEVSKAIKKAFDLGKNSLVIICDSFDKSVLNEIITTHLQTQFKLLLVKIPQFNQLEYLEDIQELIGGQVINKDIGMTFDDISHETFGTCGKIVSTKETTVLSGTKKPSKETIKKIKDSIKSTDSLFDKDKLQKRLAFLNSSIGVIRVGAESETDKEYLKLKIDDAVYATKAALEDGYVKGGGLCLKEIAEELEPNILTEALKAPYNQIQENAGGYLEIKDDVIDPAKITKNAVINSCSVAKIFITTGAVIADKNEKKKDQSLDEE